MKKIKLLSLLSIFLLPSCVNFENDPIIDVRDNISKLAATGNSEEGDGQEGDNTEESQENEEESEQIVTPTSIQNASELSVYVGSKIKIAYSVLPEESQDKEVVFSITGFNVASIDNDGTLTCLKQGTAVVNLRLKNFPEIVSSCLIHVNKPKEKINVINSNESLMVANYGFNAYEGDEKGSRTAMGSVSAIELAGAYGFNAYYTTVYKSINTNTYDFFTSFSNKVDDINKKGSSNLISSLDTSTISGIEFDMSLLPFYGAKMNDGYRYYRKLPSLSEVLSISQRYDMLPILNLAEECFNENTEYDVYSNLFNQIETRFASYIIVSPNLNVCEMVKSIKSNIDVLYYVNESNSVNNQLVDSLALKGIGISLNNDSFDRTVIDYAKTKGVITYMNEIDHKVASEDENNIVRDYESLEYYNNNKVVDFISTNCLVNEKNTRVNKILSLDKKTNISYRPLGVGFNIGFNAFVPNCGFVNTNYYNNGASSRANDTAGIIDVRNYRRFRLVISGNNNFTFCQFDARYNFTLDIGWISNDDGSNQEVRSKQNHSVTIDSETGNKILEMDFFGVTCYALLYSNCSNQDVLRNSILEISLMK